MHAGPTEMLPGVLQGTTVVEVATSPPAYSVPSGPKTASPSSQIVMGSGDDCQLSPPFFELQPPHVSGTGDGPLKIKGTGKIAPSTYSSRGLRGLTAISGSPMVMLLPLPETSISNSRGWSPEVADSEADAVNIGTATARHAAKIDHRTRSRRMAMAVPLISLAE